jgi:hypothetical protein
MNEEYERRNAKILTLIFCLYATGAIIGILHSTITMMIILQRFNPLIHGFLYILYRIPLITAMMVISIHALFTKISERSRFFILCFSFLALSVHFSDLISISARWQGNTKWYVNHYVTFLIANLGRIAAVSLATAIILYVLRLGKLRSRSMFKILLKDRVALWGSLIILLTFMPDILRIMRIYSRQFFKVSF